MNLNYRFSDVLFSNYFDLKRYYQDHNTHGSNDLY